MAKTRTPHIPKKPAPDGLDADTRDRLRAFLQDIRSLPNEAAKSHRFIGLISELFPGTSAGRAMAAGVERIVRIETEDRRKTGRIDAYYGNVVIEFENSLKATEAQARRQLCEYTAGLFAEEGSRPRPLVCVASDGVTWKTFLPRLKPEGKGKPKPGDIELEPLRMLVISEETLKDFWIWLTSLLKRLLVYRSGVMPTGLLSFCLSYAGKTGPSLPAVFTSVRTHFAGLAY
jgi:hypothetical protein